MSSVPLPRRQIQAAMTTLTRLCSWAWRGAFSRAFRLLLDSTSRNDAGAHCSCLPNVKRNGGQIRYQRSLRWMPPLYRRSSLLPRRTPWRLASESSSWRLLTVQAVRLFLIERSLGRLRTMPSRQSVTLVWFLRTLQERSLLPRTPATSSGRRELWSPRHVELF